MRNNKLFLILLLLAVATFACQPTAKDADGKEDTQTEQTDENAVAERSDPIIDVSGPKTYKVKVAKKSVGDDTTNCDPTASCFCETTDPSVSAGIYVDAELEIQNTTSNPTSASNLTVTFFYQQNGRWVQQMGAVYSTTLPSQGGPNQTENTGNILLYNNSTVYPTSVMMRVNSPNTIGNTGSDFVVLTPCN